MTRDKSKPVGFVPSHKARILSLCSRKKSRPKPRGIGMDCVKRGCRSIASRVIAPIVAFEQPCLSYQQQSGMSNDMKAVKGTHVPKDGVDPHDRVSDCYEVIRDVRRILESYPGQIRCIKCISSSSGGNVPFHVRYLPVSTSTPASRCTSISVS